MFIYFTLLYYGIFRNYVSFPAIKEIESHEIMKNNEEL